MGCSGSKDKKDSDSAPPAPVEAKADAKEEKKAEECPEDFKQKMKEFMSEELREMMRDYFNRYDLDGSNTINSTEELKQLCTNLVVKLDLEMDVAEIDKLVESAGDMEKNNWQFDEKNASGECFAHWFTDMFKVDTTWKHGDESSEEDEPTDDHPYRTGTYIGHLEGKDADGNEKKFDLGQPFKDKAGNVIGDFAFKVRYEAKGQLQERKGCDGMGYYVQKGTLDGNKVTIERDYDIDANPDTKEPMLELVGEPGEENGSMKGTWKNLAADNERAAGMMKMLGLEGVQEGTFAVNKKKHEE